MYTSESDWIPSDSMKLEKNAISAVKNLENSIIIAGPGAGKTELLAQKANFLLETRNCIYPSKIMAISFKKDAAVNLKERVELRLSENSSNRFVSQTFDSFAKSILDRFLYALPEDYRPHPDYTIDLNSSSISLAYRNSGKYLSNKELIKEQHVILTESNLDTLNGINKKAWTYLLNLNNSTLTFSMITALAIYILEKNPLILDSLRSTYSYVFLDEFQDTTNLQYKLLKKCFQHSKTSITAVGDHRQRIMLWAGAKKTIFDVYQSDFTAKKYELFMNHRSAPRLLELISTVNNYMQDTPYTPIANSRWNEDEGIAEILYFPHSEKEAEYIAEKILTLREQNNFSYRDICIIVKQKSSDFSSEVSKVLNKFQIKSRDEAPYQDLIKEEIVKLILNTLTSSINVRDSDAWLHIWETYLTLSGKSNSTNSILIDSLRLKFKEFLKDVIKRLNNIEQEKDLDILFIDILNFYDFKKICEFYPQYSQGVYVNKLREDLSHSLYNYYSESKSWWESIDSVYGNNSIPIMTIHKSKGLEYEVVFFIGFEDETFWSFKNKDSEDENIFFVALSRAKRFLYFSFSEKRFKKFQTKDLIDPLYNMLKESKVVDEKIIE